MEPSAPIRLPAESIEGHRVRIRRFRDDDAEDIQAACADPVTQRFLPALPNPYSREDALWWIAEGSSVTFAAGGGAYAVADPATDRLLGGIGLTHLRERTGEIGYWIAPWARRRGVATAATRTLSDYGFSAGYQRLQLLTVPENAASQRVAISAGYVREGLQRAGTFGRDGTRHDVIVWSRLPDDPPGPSRRLLPDLPEGQLTDGVIRLRPLGADDERDVHSLRSLPEVVAVTVPPVPPSAVQTGLRCAHAAAEWLAGTAARLTIRHAADDGFAGEIGLYYSDPATAQAMVGYEVAPAWRGRGFATRAVRLVARWAFAEAGIARLVAGAAPDNVASQRVLLAAGFAREGYQRARLPGPGGQRIDDVLYAQLSARPTRPRQAR
jgi:RimJ/RimL family protein N-acetyltransferase